MPRTCTICRHAQRDHINGALVSACGTLRGLASTFGVSASSLRRHRADHLPEVLTKAKSLDDIATAESLTDQVRTLRARALAVLGRAEANGDAKLELAALRELRALTELEARGTDHDAAVIHVTIVQQFIQHMIEVVREFVPPERVDTAIARIEFAASQGHADAPSIRLSLPNTSR